MSQLARRGFGGMAWLGSREALRIVVNLGAVAVLSRLLDPSAFGLAALAIAVAVLAEVVAGFGFASALIQRREVDDDLLTAVFWTNLGIAALLSLAVAGGAGPLAALFGEPDAKPILQAIAPIFLILGARVVHRSLLEKTFAFRRLALAEGAGVLVGAVVAIGLAAAGAGVWALVAQQLAMAVAITGMMMAGTGWTPRLRFRFSALQPILGFGGYLMTSTLVQILLKQADRPVISRLLGAHSLGYYSLAQQLVVFPLDNVVTLLARVMYPILAAVREPDRLRDTYLAMLHATALLVVPLSVGVALIAEPAVAVLLGSGWGPVAALLVWMAPAAIFSAINRLAMLVFVTTGRGALHFRWGSISAGVALVTLGLGAVFGLEGVAVGRLAGQVLMVPALCIAAFPLIGASVGAALRAVAPVFVAAAAMATAILTVQASFEMSVVVDLVVSVGLGAVVFLAVEILLDRRRIFEGIRMLRDRASETKTVEADVA